MVRYVIHQEMGVVRKKEPSILNVGNLRKVHPPAGMWGGEMGSRLLWWGSTSLRGQYVKIWMMGCHFFPEH